MCAPWLVNGDVRARQRRASSTLFAYVCMTFCAALTFFSYISVVEARLMTLSASCNPTPYKLNYTVYYVIAEDYSVLPFSILWTF